jgi:hypothetical protein
MSARGEDRVHRSGGPPATRQPGAWLAWSAVSALCRLDLRPPSSWQVLLAVVSTSARYGGREARLGIDDLCRLTGLAPRTVKRAVAALIARKLLVRVGRYGRLRADLFAAPAGGANKLAPPAEEPGDARGANKLAPPRGQLIGTSPTSFYVSSFLEEKSRQTTFTANQLAAIEDVLAEATELLGSDAAMLAVPDEAAVALGLRPEITYGEGFETVTRSGDHVLARDFTRAVLNLRQDERVQGRELE